MRKSLFVIFFVIGFAMTAHALCVTAPMTNLRSGPGPKHSVSWVVAKYTPLIEVSKSGQWIEVEDMDGETHWVYAPNVTSKMVCVSVKVNTVKLRKSPGGQSELADIRQVGRYTPFKRLDAQGEWYQVEASWGESYWIHEQTVWRPVKVSPINF